MGRAAKQCPGPVAAHTPAKGCAASGFLGAPARARAAVRLLVLALVCCLAAQAARAADNTVYVNDFNSPFTIYTINTATGALTAAGTLSFTSIAIARRASDGLIFYTEYGVTNGRVATWNPATNTNTTIGTLGRRIPNFPRLAFDANGVLYGMDDQSHLYTVNTTNGAATDLGAVAGFPASIRGDMAFAPNGTLYATAGDSSSLYTINIGALTSSTVGATGQTNIAGMAFANGGTLYAVESTSPDDLQTINTGTGASTVVASIATALYDMAAMPKFADLSVTKTASSSFVVGSNATYSISVTNNGPQSASGPITVSDTLPTGLTYVSGTGTGWTCSASGQAVTCTTAGPLANGATLPAITLTVAVGSAAAPSVTNTAAVASTTFDHVATNDTSTVTTTVLLPTDLTISKSHSGNFTQGQSGTYTVTVSNSGGVASSGTVTVTDTLPSGLTPGTATGTGWTCSTSGQTVTCTRNDALSGGSSYPAISVPVTVAPNSALSVTNTASVSGGNDSNTGNNTASDPTTVNGVPDLTVSKSHSGNFTQGQTGTYTITASNAGGAATSGVVTVTDTLPAGLNSPTGSGTGWTCNTSGQTVTCTRSDALAAGASYPAITVSVSVASNASLSVTNSASVSGGGQTNTGNDSASDPTTINGVPDLTVAKTHSGNFTQGGSGSYTVTVTNSGGAATSGTVTVTDTVPSGLTSPTGSGTGWTCSTSGLTVTCTRSDALAAGSSYPAITVGVSVAPNSPLSVTNTASVSGGGQTNTSNDTANDATTVNGVPDVTITKTHSGTFTQGQSGTYTLTVSNAGGAATSGTVTVTDTVPAGLSSPTGSGTGWSCSTSGQTVTCTRSDALAAGASYPAITLSVSVAPNSALSVTNSASVSGGGQTNTSNDSASDPTTINGVPDLTVSKSHSGNFTQGQAGTYTVTVTNSGGAATSGLVTVTDTVPAGLSSPTGSGAGWSCSTSGQTVTCTRSDALAAGASYPNITLTVNVAANAPSSVTNTASVSGGGQTNTANDSSSDPTTVNGVPDLTVSKSHTGNFSQGQAGATYSLTVTNAGGAVTSGVVTVTDTAPAGLASPVGSGTGWTCSTSGQTVTCTRSSALAAGASYPAITVTVDVATNAPSSVTNTASVSGGGQTNTANDTANDPTTINGAPNLTIAKSHAGNFTRGQSGSYTITVTNSGGAATSGVVTVTDTLPAGLTSPSGSGTGWTCSTSGQTVTCTRSNALAAGSSYPAITVTASVAQSAASSVTNTASVSGGGQTFTGDDSASDPTTVVSSADLSLAKTVNNSSPIQGQNVTFTVTLANAGPSDATNVAVTDALPAGLTFVSATPSAGSYNSGTGVWSVATLASGASATLQIVAHVDNAGTINNTAEVTASDQPDPDSTPNNHNAAEDDQASASIGAAAPPAVSLVKSVSPGGTQRPGTDLTYTVVFTNSGGAAATNFVLTDPDPATTLRINDNTDFKVGSVVNDLGTTGLSVTVSYSNDGGATFTYTPTSGGGGAPAGYDSNVTHVRWSFTGNLSQTAPNNTGSVSFTTRIR